MSKKKKETIEDIRKTLEEDLADHLMDIAQMEMESLSEKYPELEDDIWELSYKVTVK